MTSKKIAIIGGGIGGLTLAIALQRRGLNVSVFENASQIKPLGAGLVLAANAVKALTEIGISDEILQAGKILKLFSIKDESGNILTETDSEKLTLRLGVVNNFTIHRADLHAVLVSQVIPGTLLLNKGLTDFHSKHSGITLNFADGTTEHTDYLIACDGIHSVIRKKLLPESNPRYAGYTCFRAVIDNPSSNIDIDETSETWGKPGRFGIVPLNNNRIYWFACINAPTNNIQMRGAKISDLLTYFGKYHFPIPQIVENTQDHQLIWSDISDIKPIKQFAFGKIVLMGDAAHATTPNMGQGACMAIEDAAVMANCLDHYSSVEEAFKQFEKKRIGRTTSIVNHSRIIGKMAQLENSLLIKVRNAALKLTPAHVTENQVRRLTEVSFT
jgi:2-polyprenyl-6-methoxyphenol hydroxylase-like FAD-dependent oxidoreductase